MTDNLGGMTTPSNNPRNPFYCDACHTRIRQDECACHNNGGWRWGSFHTESDESEGE